MGICLSYHKPSCWGMHALTHTHAHSHHLPHVPAHLPNAIDSTRCLCCVRAARSHFRRQYSKWSVLLRFVLGKCDYRSAAWRTETAAFQPIYSFSTHSLLYWGSPGSAGVYSNSHGEGRVTWRTSRQTANHTPLHYYRLSGVPTNMTITSEKKLKNQVRTDKDAVTNNQTPHRIQRSLAWKQRRKKEVKMPHTSHCVGSSAWVMNSSLRVELLWHLSEKCLLQASGCRCWRTCIIASRRGSGMESFVALAGGRSAGVDTHWEKRTWEEEAEEEEEWAIYPFDNGPKFGTRGDEHQ